MLGDQEEFISELYDKNGRYLSCWLILYAPKTGRYHPKNIIQTFSENLTKNKRGVSNGCIPQGLFLSVWFIFPSLYTRLPRTTISILTSCARKILAGYATRKTCAGCGKEITNKDIVKGFEYDKDKYVIVTDDDFEKIKTEKDLAYSNSAFYWFKLDPSHLLR